MALPPWGMRAHRGDMRRQRTAGRRSREHVSEMSPVRVASRRCTPAWPKDALRISFGIIWLIDAVLKWLPGFRSGYMDTIMGQAQSHPG
jgi:hypothetical protein